MRSLKILQVEDEPDIREITAGGGSGEGLLVVTWAVGGSGRSARLRRTGRGIESPRFYTRVSPESGCGMLLFDDTLGAIKPSEACCPP